jgi:hypothetical protein
MSHAKEISKGTDIILYGPGTSGEHKLNDAAAEKFMNIGSKFVFSYEAGLKDWSDGGNIVDRGNNSEHISRKTT